MNYPTRLTVIPSTIGDPMAIEAKDVSWLSKKISDLVTHLSEDEWLLVEVTEEDLWFLLSELSDLPSFPAEFNEELLWALSEALPRQYLNPDASTPFSMGLSKVAFQIKGSKNDQFGVLASFEGSYFLVDPSESPMQVIHKRLICGYYVSEVGDSFNEGGANLIQINSEECLSALSGDALDLERDPEIIALPFTRPLDDASGRGLADWISSHGLTSAAGLYRDAFTPDKFLKEDAVILKAIIENQHAIHNLSVNFEEREMFWISEHLIPYSRVPYELRVLLSENRDPILRDLFIHFGLSRLLELAAPDLQSSMESISEATQVLSRALGPKALGDGLSAADEVIKIRNLVSEAVQLGTLPEQYGYLNKAEIPVLGFNFLKWLANEGELSQFLSALEIWMDFLRLRGELQELRLAFFDRGLN